MTNEERILERLEAMEERLAQMQAKAEEKNPFWEIVTPVTADVFKTTVEKLEVLNGRVELEDFMDFGKKALLNVPNFTWLLGALESMRSLVNIIAPEITPNFQLLLAATAKMEENGTFAKLSASKDAMCNVFENLSVEDIKNLSESITFLMTLLTHLADPKVQNAVNTLVEILKSLDLSDVKPAGIFGLLKALNDPDTKKVLGVLVQALKQVGNKL